MMNVVTRSEQGLGRRVEEASLNAWPAMQQMLLDGWLLRFSRGFTKRANSIVPLYPSLQRSPEAVAEKIRYCENLYAREQLHAIFRLTSIAGCHDLDRQLEARGYRHADPTLVLSAPVDGSGAQPSFQPSFRPSRHPEFKLMTRQDWLGIYGWLSEMPTEAQGLHGALLRGIQGQCAFGVMFDDGHPVACGLAVVDGELLGLFDVVTHPARRRAGHGTALVGSLLAWGAGQHTRVAYLQVVAGNAAALTLYERLGFARLYDYWYRISG